MYSSGSDGTATVGGKNPAQIGYGSQVASIDLNMTTSNFAPGNPMDCMLYGDGFFLVGDKDVANVIDPTDPSSLKSLTLTRVGDFQFGPRTFSPAFSLIGAHSERSHPAKLRCQAARPPHLPDPCNALAFGPFSFKKKDYRGVEGEDNKNEDRRV